MGSRQIKVIHGLIISIMDSVPNKYAKIQKPLIIGMVALLIVGLFLVMTGQVQAGIYMWLGSLVAFMCAAQINKKVGVVEEERTEPKRKHSIYRKQND